MTWRQRSSATSVSLKAIARQAALDPAPLVLRSRPFTAAKGGLTPCHPAPGPHLGGHDEPGHVWVSSGERASEAEVPRGKAPVDDHLVGVSRQGDRRGRLPGRVAGDRALSPRIGPGVDDRAARPRARDDRVALALPPREAPGDPAA